MSDSRIILHLDFDSFFASVEQQYNPSLRGIPVGVTATNGRTCIIAASREAKKFGITTGSRTFEAKKIYPDLALVPADFVKYFEISKKFLKICQGFSPLIELFSIDEAFLDITQTNYLFGGVLGVVSAMRERIKEEIGEYITASFGISHNKLLAKLASGLKKPNGLVFIDKENVDSIYKNAKLTDICGIGERLAKRLHALGALTLLDLRLLSHHELVSEFGPSCATFLQNIAFGIDTRPVISYTNSPTVKSVGRNYCLPKNEYNKRIVLQNAFELYEEVGIKLRRLSKKAKTIGLSLRGNIDIGGRKTFCDYTDSGVDMFHRSFATFIKETDYLSSGNSNYYIRQISVWVENLEDSCNIPLGLFDNEKSNRLVKTIDLVNEKFGDHTIRRGFLLYADKLTTVPNGYMADKYERTKLAEESVVL